ncbi:hypothetical protein SERLA73DRAFT_158795 [Serpula lacrymans var. lacrymans S7.3]|uniref:Uncharacterized protein n=1 Tax=Serpula lacrymans var. lacrymans (strain S7.3) TaxID=936435 RepID=F8PQ34_SERL3|nr:hypothetical protein SERLA73DRAFT_158795 [Serpula lacrymans var. lacrymans S7.3]
MNGCRLLMMRIPSLSMMMSPKRRMRSRTASMRKERTGTLRRAKAIVSSLDLGDVKRVCARERRVAGKGGRVGGGDGYGEGLVGHGVGGEGGRFGGGGHESHRPSSTLVRRERERPATMLELRLRAAESANAEAGQLNEEEGVRPVGVLQGCAKTGSRRGVFTVWMWGEAEESWCAKRV